VRPVRLVCFGAGELADALCRVAEAVGWEAVVVDPREGFAALAVLSHVHELDDAALVAALDSDARYIGVRGSRATQAARRERLLAAGVPDAQLARVSAPTGLDLGGSTPEEMALAIVAEIVALGHGREGGRLVHRTGSIREGAA
jgi:xanthine dehydrogenase accessory factor